jgi:hypothetical protein
MWPPVHVQPEAPHCHAAGGTPVCVQVLEAAGSCKEAAGPGQHAGGDAAAALLVQQYQQYVAQNGSTAPTGSQPGRGSFGDIRVGQQLGDSGGGGTAASPSPWVSQC